MIGQERVIAVVPARGGSKSVPYKNIRELGGKPLIGWSIEVAQKSKGVDRVIVSTDDEKIANVARQFGAEVYMRPAHLATDEALVEDAIRNLYLKLREEGETSDVMILLEPTCPFRNHEDVERCLNLLPEKKYDSVATFKEAELNPHRAWKISDTGPETFMEGADPWLPRQKLPKAYQLNGAVYVFRPAKIMDGSKLLAGQMGAVVMPPERSIDIDKELDFRLAEAHIQRQRPQPQVEL